VSRSAHALAGRWLTNSARMVRLLTLALVTCATSVGALRRPVTLSRRAVAFGAAAVPLSSVRVLPARARECDPTTGEQCMGNFWESGKFTYSKDEQLENFASSGDSGRTVLRLTARLQRQRAAFQDLGPMIALGEVEEARRRLRSPPLDDVRKSSSEIAVLGAADSRKSRAAQKRFTGALDRLDSELMLAGRKDRSIDGLDVEFGKARSEFDSYLNFVGVPIATTAEPAGK